VKIAADANALLAAVLGGRANLILQHPEIEEVVTAEECMDEVQEYTPILARKKSLREDVLLLAVATLPVTVIERKDYAPGMAEASRRIGQRDPDDIPILALALTLNVPLWSNDKDFKDVGMDLYTTERLLRRLGIIGAE
jgi:predicted nucleic acid-binding protein